MSKLTKKEEKQVPSVPMVASHATSFDGDPSDILIPKLLIGQSTSEVVQNEKVSFGQIWRSTTEKAVGGRGEPVQVIPLTMFKNWVVFEKVGKKFEFSRLEPFVNGVKLDWYFEEEGAEMKREQALNFYCLLPQDIDADRKAREDFAVSGILPNSEDALLPVMLQFKSTSYKAGRQLATHFAQASDFGVPPYAMIFNVDTVKTTNDQGTFYIYSAERATKTPDQYGAACAKWYDIVKTSRVKVDESDLNDSVSGESAHSGEAF